MAEKKIKIKIAVGVDSDGDYYAAGWSNSDNEQLWSTVDENLSSAISRVFVEFEIPEQEIKTYVLK